tara:strand:+ start:10163 stop:10828 length:666 start_codon:yes stop_codon:yes gene_type:complete
MVKILTLFVASTFLMACSDDKHVAKVAYEVEIVNLTHNQPFSPLALRAHGASYAAWTIGESASLGIEQIAESGDNSEFLGSASSKKSASGTGIIAPGETAVIDLNSKVTDLYLTAVTMLVNTNDAFAGITGLNLSSLQVGDNTVVYLPVYDAGTEENDELAGTIPGPADGGTGFDVARNDVDFVAMHPGVVSADDGYADSVLGGSHKFDGPAAKLTITRIN